LCIKAAASEQHTRNSVSTKILGGDRQSSAMQGVREIQPKLDIYKGCGQKHT
jgi:hypothetical protein